MRRRTFMSLIGGAVLAWPLAARAQQPAMPVIGFLSSRSPGESASSVTAFRAGLRDRGFVEGQNLAIAFRWAEGHYERLPELAADLVDLRVAVLFAAGGRPSALAAKAATSSIPVVFSAVTDPVRLGLVPSLNRPSGNVTGMSLLNSEMIGKSAQLLKEMVPTAAAIAFVVNPSNPSVELFTREAETAAKALAVRVHVLSASTEQDLNEAFASLGRLGAAGVVVPAEPFLVSQRDRIVALAARSAVPMISNLREFVVAGGLMSYGPSLTDAYRRAGAYVGRVLKTAKALGLTVPPTLLAIADEVIE